MIHGPLGCGSDGHSLAAPFERVNDGSAGFVRLG
jgi:hypothetical protein